MAWGQDEIINLIGETEKGSKLPPGLMLAVAKTESSLNPNAVGPKTKYGTAKGLFQFIDSTADQYGVKQFDPKSSAVGARRMLEDLWDEHGGDLDKVLASYNWGVGNVRRNGMDNLPQQTREYLVKVRKALGGSDSTQASAPKSQPAQADGTAVASYLPSLGDIKSQAATYSDELMGMIKRIFGQEVQPVQAAPAPQPAAPIRQVSQEPAPERPATRKSPTKRSVRQRLAEANNSAEQLLGVVDSISGLPSIYNDNSFGDLNSVSRSEYMASLAKLLQQFKESPDSFNMDIG